MSLAGKRRPYKSTSLGEATDRQESLRQVKLQVEKLSEQLKKSVLDNPRLAKKSAVLISLWIEGKSRPTRPKK